MSNERDFEKLLSDRNHADYNCYLFLVNNRDLIQEAIEASRHEDYMDSEEADELHDELDDLIRTRDRVNDELLTMVAQSGLKPQIHKVQEAES